MCELVSVIIPAYNARDYIERCLDSICSQTYKSLEIIIVNDGSNDNTLEFCERYAVKDSRIKVIDQINSGVSEARNTGLKNATGKYVQFVDADDYLDKTITRRLVENIADTELVVSSFYKNNKDGLCEDERVYSGTVDIAEYAELMTWHPSDFYFGVVWNKLFKRDLIINNNLFFDRNINFGEDFIFNMEYLKLIKKVKLLPEYLYYYTDNNAESLTGKEPPCERRMKQREVLFEAYVRFFKAVDLYDKMKKQVDRYMIKHAIFEYGKVKYVDKIKGAQRSRDLRCVRQTLKKYDLLSLGVRIRLPLSAWKIDKFPDLDFHKMLESFHHNKKD